MTTTLPRTRVDPPSMPDDRPPPGAVWHRAAFATLLAGTAALHLWGLSSSG